MTAPQNNKAQRPLPLHPILSVIVPCFNEQAVIEATHRQLKQSLSTIDWLDHELVYINDGSEDQTLDLLKKIRAGDDTVRIISLSRNFGHQVAVSAGLDHAGGHAVVVIDADLQDPPDLIEEMLDHWRDGVDVVYGVRAERHGESAWKLLTARAFYQLINRLSDTPIPLDTGDFRLMDRQVVDAFLAMPERDRFVRGMVAWLGFRQQALHYTRKPRQAGSSKYPLRKMVRFALDGILSFSLAPLRLASWVGFTAAALSIVGIFYALALRLLTNIWVPGWTLLFIAVLLIGGIQLMSLGIIGEYIGRVYGEVKRRPLYVVQERLGFPDSTESLQNNSSGG